MKNRNAYWREYRLKNIEHKRAIERKSQSKPEAVTQKAIYMKKWRKKNKEKRKKYLKEYLKKFPTREKLKYMIKTGKIKKMPCEKCGQEKSEGHHYNGYEGENAFKIQWLCRFHHREIHRI